jgi:hypothetical protein
VGEASRTSTRNKGVIVPPEQHARGLRKLMKLKDEKFIGFIRGRSWLIDRKL